MPLTGIGWLGAEGTVKCAQKEDGEERDIDGRGDDRDIEPVRKAKGFQEPFFLAISATNYHTGNRSNHFTQRQHLERGPMVYGTSGRILEIGVQEAI